MPQATINLTVKDAAFHDLFPSPVPGNYPTGRGLLTNVPADCIAIATNGNSDGLIVLDSTTGNIKILNKNGEKKITFTILGENGHTYLAQGISFSQISGNTSDPLGAANFSTSAVSGNSITLTAKRANLGVWWKYYIMIQREDNRAIGMIDPTIENDALV